MFEYYYSNQRVDGSVGELAFVNHVIEAVCELRPLSAPRKLAGALDLWPSTRHETPTTRTVPDTLTDPRLLS